MKIISIIILLLSSCTNAEKSQNSTDIPLEKRIEFTKLVLTETDHKYNDINMGGNTKFSAHHSRIWDMLDKVKTSVLRGDSTTKIDFTLDYNFFNSQERYDVNYFKSKKLTPKEALFVIDQLLYSLRNSELGNNYFKYSYPEFKFSQTNSGDSLDFSFTPNQMLKKMSFLGPEKYCDSPEYVKKNIIDMWVQKMDISKYKVGDTITGGILMRKMNAPVFVPFRYVKK